MMKRYSTTTDEFVAQFTRPADFTGDIAEMVGRGIMPTRVDRGDERVKAIVDRCRRNTAPASGTRDRKGVKVR